MAQGRELFALPGKVGESNSETPNRLIKEGANVALSAEDIILHFDFLYHDVIDYRGFKRGKLHSDFHPKLIEKYRVSSEVRFGAERAIGAETPSEMKPFEPPKVVTEPTESVAETVCVPDNSSEILASLDSVSIRVFEAMPIDKAVTTDDFLILGLGVSEVMTALTVLEINGLVVSLPGGAYLRK